MKLGPVTKLDKRKKATSKEFDYTVMLKNCDVIITFLVYGQFEAIQNPDSGRIVCKAYVFISSNLLFYKN